MPLTLKINNSAFNPWENKRKGLGFWCHNYIILWEASGKIRTWKHICLRCGIRRSEKIQYLPIWLVNNNSTKGILFGVWKFFVEISYRY